MALTLKKINTVTLSGKKQRARIANISSEAKALGQEFATLLTFHKIINVFLGVCRVAHLFALVSTFF